MSNQIVWFDVPVLDLDRAIAWYSAVLGNNVDKESIGPGAWIGVLPHGGNDVGGCLVVGADKPSAGGVLVYLNCQGRLDDAIGAATKNGGKIVQPTHSIAPHGSRCVVMDSEGNRVALHSM